MNTITYQLHQPAYDPVKASPFIPAGTDAPRYTAADQANNKTLQPQIITLIEQIEHHKVRGVMLSVFSDLARLLEYLRLMEADLQQDCSLQEMLTIFTLVHVEARALLDFIEARAMRADGISEALFEALDGTSYAIKHELRRVFESELIGLSTTEASPSAHSKITHAHGLLSNCFQQSIITLAQVFNPTLDGACLFNDFQTRLEQSLVLCKDLWTLIQLAQRAEKESTTQSIISLVKYLEAVRHGSMHYLMYRDWEEFDRCAGEVTATSTIEEFVPVLHRFARYLETLLGQVRMRAVLKDHPLDFPDISL